jgi:LCP family protein required for cell wall assembly
LTQLSSALRILREVRVDLVFFSTQCAARPACLVDNLNLLALPGGSAGHGSRDLGLCAALTPKPPIIARTRWQRRQVSAEHLRVDSGVYVSQIFTDDAESEDPDTGPAAQRRRRRTWLALGLATGALLIVGALIASALYVVSIDQAVHDNLRRSSGQLPAETPAAGEEPRPAKSPGKAVNYVLMGSDSRDVSNAGHGRSDVLMVMHLSADRKSAYMISFPRDMYVPIPGHGKNKINAAFAFGGPPLTVRTLEGLLDTRMDHVALIDFEGFIKLTEELGGVTVYNKHPSNSGGYNFPVGDITLRGQEALAYVRERKQLPRGDLDRAERQRIVLQAILAKGLAKETISNPAKFVSFARGVAQHVTVDDQLTESELRKTALSLRLRAKDVYMLQAPISGFGTSPTNQSIDIVDKKRLAQLATALQNDKMDKYLDKYPER